MKKLYFLIVTFFFFHKSFAIKDTVTVPLFRQYFHDKINNEQKLCDKVDGRFDNMMRIGSNDEINIRVSDVLYRKVNELQDWIELNDQISKNNDKVRLLSYIEVALRSFRTEWKKREFPPAEFPQLIEMLEKIIKAQETESSIAPFIQNTSYNIAKILTDVFSDNIGYKEAKNIVYFKYCELHPDLILSSIRPYVNESFSDSLITIACKNNPSQLYTYAQSVNTPEGKLIHKSKNNLVKTVGKLSQTPNALMYFPFLDDILSGKNSVENIQKIIGDGETGYDSIAYFKLLVKTEISYFQRMSSVSKDTPIAYYGPNGLRETLKDKAIRHFINPINALHNESNLNVRMKAIDPLTPMELYFMIVMGENDIYTSSYKHSFNRMLQKMGSKPRGDSLLLSVQFDFFKKFIKMAANYNKLDTFLKCMPVQSSESLMKAFVANLDKSENLEDATDVADSYSSINTIKLKKSILSYVKENEEQSIFDDNEKGNIIYNILKNIFLSEDSTNKIDLTSIAGISSIYDVNTSELRDDSGRIVQQVFFYGDEDGKTYFTPFLNSFSSKEWFVSMKKEWVEIKSLKGNVWIYANRPLDSDANLDDSAQVHLNEYLDQIDVHPTIVIHRGHSYWLPGTISRMPVNARIVLIGSCGGYKNLNKILEVSPDAHIISTKEIGAGDINRPIMNYLNQMFISNSTIVWKDMWNNLSNQFSQDKSKNVKESWESYIPPYKNLGAIFIKAYQKATKDM